MVSLRRLRPRRESDREVLTTEDIGAMRRHGILRAAHHLWLAEQYMSDLSKLGDSAAFDDNLESLSSVSSFMERMVDDLLK